jgi:hypothetical protein
LLVGLDLFSLPSSGQPVRVERKMNIDLTETEIIHLMDCIGGRMDDLNDCAAFGDAGALAVEIETLDELMTKLSEALRA